MGANIRVDITRSTLTAISIHFMSKSAVPCFVVIVIARSLVFIGLKPEVRLAEESPPRLSSASVA